MAGRGAALVVGILAAATLAAQSPPQGHGLIVGRVVDATTSRPVAGATVALIGSPSALGDAQPADAPATNAPRVLTDDAGQFLFRNLPGAAYGLTASAPSYLDGALGQSRPAGPSRPFVLRDDERAGSIIIRLWHEATISGHVTDDSGAPVVDVWVSLLKRGSGGAAASGRTSARFALSTARTDDRGAYHFDGLAPADYFVAVPSRTTQGTVGAAGVAAPGAVIRAGDLILQTSSDGMAGGTNVLSRTMPTSVSKTGRVAGYATTFLPGAMSMAGASVIALKAGDARTGADIELKSTAMVSVSGAVTGPGGAEAGLPVHLVPAFAAGDPLERTFETAVTITDQTGAFVFRAVPAGPYVVEAWRVPQILVIGRDPLAADTSVWGRTSITVADNAVDHVALTVQPGRTISGQVKFEGTAGPPSPTSLQTTLSVAFEPPWSLAFGARMATRVAANFDFGTQGLPPGEYFANLPNQFAVRGWYFESAVHDGHDLTVEPLVLGTQDVSGVTITFSDQPSKLSGAVTDAGGKPDPTASVLVFPVDYHAWIDHGLSSLALRTSQATQNATYALAIRPGEYLVAAVSEDVAAAPLTAAAVQAIAGTAVRVTIARGESKVLNLKRGPR
jgi:protocatechuate 3,4-dioxygenase beta subunit